MLTVTYCANLHGNNSRAIGIAVSPMLPGVMPDVWSEVC